MFFKQLCKINIAVFNSLTTCALRGLTQSFVIPGFENQMQVIF